ncbi:alpha/beta hydrolase family protein [Paenibacillus sp. IITD108]|uniref:alpha/beta hydrolase family protein n=1 Tax=Paenibacillus sp. IITD108 TaxID=3116649 RepID=UPI002F3E2027
MNILNSTGCTADIQLREEIAERCRRQLKKLADARSRAASCEEWECLRRPLLDVIRAAFPTFMYDRGPLTSRVVSRHNFGDYRVENVIFESYPGWEVNGTVYLPAQPGRYPGVVCPTGHSCKTGESYQISAQTFALNGYAAISFDPPGVAGEIGHMNDHFTNGLIGYLTGIWSNTHFVLDAIRCIDYLETRDDIDFSSGGVAMTGVSGGGATTIYASLLDDRIRFLAPVCCLNEHESLHLTDWYTSCPEQFATGLIAHGIDFTDLIALQAPKPCLIVGGREDDLFDYRNTQRLYHDAADVYRLYGRESELGLFLDDCGHAYSLNMANEVVRWMNRVFKPGVQPLPLRLENLSVQKPELLHCHPSNEVNMYTINRDEGRRLFNSRAVPVGEAGSTYLKERLRQTLGLEHADFPREADASSRVRVQEQKPTGAYQFRAVSLRTTFVSEVPGLMLRRTRPSSGVVGASADASGRLPAVLMIDEAGKWDGFRCFGPLTALGDALVYSIDVSGFGELAPRPVWHDVAPWCDIERVLTYLSVAADRPIMGLRVRDALHAWQYMRGLPEVDPNRLILAGKGLGATVALLTSLLIGPFHKLVLWDSLLNYQALTEEFPFAWKQSVVVPDILLHYDLQDLLRNAPCSNKTVINPLNAAREFVDLTHASALYPEDVQIFAGLEESRARDAFVQAILAE